MLNKIMLIGRLGRDPELKSTASGKQVAKFSIAVDDGYGERKLTDWFDVSAWEKTGEACAAHLHKGSLVFLEGSIHFREWEDQSGNKRKAAEVTARNVQFLDNKKSSEPSEGQDSQW